MTDNYQVLYSDIAPTTPIRLGQLFVDEALGASLASLKICTSLSPVTYTSLVPSGGAAPADETYLTVSDESGTLPNSRRTVAGTNITFDDSVANVRTINGPAGANPSASVGLSAVNGAATTFMRSDGAPALDQSIAPTWSGSHIFTANLPIQIQNNQPAFQMEELDQGSDGKKWRLRGNGGNLLFETRLDDNSVGTNALRFTRSGAAVASVEIGNATDNPPCSFLGTGAVSMGGTLAVTGNVGFNGASPAAMPNYTVTNPTTNRSLDVAAAAIGTVRQVLGTVIADLIAIGLYQ